MNYNSFVLICLHNIKEVCRNLLWDIPQNQPKSKPMEFYNESLKTLTEDAIVYLQNKGKSKSTIDKYIWTWHQIDKSLHVNNILEVEKSGVIEYLREKFGNQKLSELTHYQKNCFSQALNLIQFKEAREMFESIEYIPKEKPNFDGEIGNLILDFIILKKSRRLSDKTLHNYRWYLYSFFKHLNESAIFQLQEISPLAILTYCAHLASRHLGARHASLGVLRTFLRYAYEEKKTMVDLSLVVPHDNYKNQSKLPSTYNKEEARLILETADRTTAVGKRNYAILLLIIRLGLRASDVRGLSFENINWGGNTVSFEQLKTCEKIELPLPLDVGEAIIDYLKYGRPETSDCHVFVEHIAPYQILGENAVPKIANKAICHSGIDISYRKHGSHSLRHTMASFLLEGQTPLPVISNILGHGSIQTTMCYLRVDVENLRQCALDIPAVNENFYTQKGGAFYE